MAKQTRQQRRARRAQQEPALAGAAAPPRQPARPTAAGDAEARRPAPRPRAGEERRRSGPIAFLQEAIGELKKVEWPDQKAVVSGTAVVLVACVIVGVFLWLNDELWKYVVQHVLLR